MPSKRATPDYVRPPPLRPLVFAQISHARPRATPKGPRHTTATRATARTELTIPITRPLHYTSRPPLFPCLSTRGGNTPCEDKLFFLLKSQPLARCAPLLHSNIHARSTARGCPGDLRQPAADLAHDPSHPMHHFSSAGPHNYSPATSPLRAAARAVPARWPWPTDDRTQYYAACDLVASMGCIAVLERARADGCDWGPSTCSAAARGGHLELLKWARSQGCLWDQQTCGAGAAAATSYSNNKQ